MSDQGKSTEEGAAGPPIAEVVPVVGVGASAGGIEALERFFGAVPEDMGMAFVVILHLDPARESQVAEVLARQAPFPVVEVTEPVVVEPNQAYVISPHTNLVLSGDRVCPDDLSGNRPRHPVDIFFRSLAEARGSSAVGVVLSGSGSDGALGLLALREAGGITVAQDPDDAAYRGMPENAVSVGRAELVLPVEEIPARIAAIRSAGGLRPPTEPEPVLEKEEAPPVLEAAIEEIMSALLRETNRDFSGYKRSTLLRRVDRRMRFLQIRTLKDYAERVDADPSEARALFDNLLISVSRFFRDPEAWQALATKVIPDLFERRQLAEAVRVWVPGCATGEEAYTVAMLLAEHAVKATGPVQVQIFATDIDQEALSFAREGIYPESIAADVGDERMDRFFTREGSHVRVKRSVRETVLFSLHDLLSDPPFSRLDLVTCRNLLIYLDQNTQEAAIQRIHYGLREDGYLFLGTSESVSGEYFEPLDKKNRIYRRAPGRTPLPLNGVRTPFVAGQGKDVSPMEVRGALTPERVHGRLLRENGAPSLVVDEKYRVVHISQGMGRYLEYREGEPTDDLLKLVSEPLELELRTALFRAFRNGEWSTHTVRTLVEGESRLVKLEVRPGRKGTPLASYALVTIEELPRPPAGEEGVRTVSASEEMVQELENELRKTKQHLRATIEEREATIEELQTANEELKSANEEQQAAREELEARREELQSMNEELATINQEHRSKIEELAEVNSDLRNFMASTELATVFLNRDQEVRRFTPPATEIFNLLPTDEGRSFSHITHSLKGVGNLVHECDAVLKSGEPLEIEAESRHGRWYSVRVLPYRNAEGELEGVVITCYDITDLKAIEADLKKTRDQARAAEKAKGDFVTRVSHEIRTPLNAIMGYAQLVGDGSAGPLTEKQEHYLRRIDAGVRHLDFMIQQILTFSRLEAGSEAAVPEDADAHTLAREATAVLRPLAEDKGLELDLKLESGDPAIVTDAGKVRQILLNLGMNAVRFTDHGKVTVAVGDDGDGILFEVRDTGPGIAPDDLDSVFERFWQGGDEDRAGARERTGLGLSLARSLAELLGGRIDVESELGEGSVFTVRLPRTFPESAPVTDSASSSPSA